MSDVPDDWRGRVPCMSERAWRGLAGVLQHVDGPRWNRTIGDRVGEGELAELEGFRRELAEEPLEAGLEPSARTVARVEALRERLFPLAELPLGFDVARDFAWLPTTSREDIVRRLEDLIPHDAPLDPAIVYTTSGTTGHPVLVPSLPAVMVKNLAHSERLAALHGASLEPREGVPFATNLSWQRRTYVFATTMSGWNGAVFAKLNLAPHDWAGGAGSRDRFLRELAPAFVSSEPLTLDALVRLELRLAPRLVVSSAVTLGEAHARHLADALGAPVVDLYSSTETGPLAATVPGLPGHVVLAPDLYLEVLDERGNRVPDGTRGELTVTGGRNPLLPLVRYRTGDFGRLATVTLPDGRPARTILELEGRAAVSFRATDGRPVTAVDVARSIRPVAHFVQHAFHQRADGSLRLALRPIPGVPVPADALDHALRELFGAEARIAIELDAELGSGSGKVIAWRSDLA